jgi:plasmid stabilization system protein ParE
MDFQIILTDLFVSDLKEIVDYLVIRADGHVAGRVGNEVLDRALEIGRNPWLGREVKQRPGVRKVILYSYLIYYEVDEANHAVNILRAWHGARDPKTLRLEP